MRGVISLLLLNWVNLHCLVVHVLRSIRRRLRLHLQVVCGRAHLILKFHQHAFKFRYRAQFTWPIGHLYSFISTPLTICVFPVK